MTSGGRVEFEFFCEKNCFMMLWEVKHRITSANKRDCLAQLMAECWCTILILSFVARSPDILDLGAALMNRHRGINIPIVGCLTDLTEFIFIRYDPTSQTFTKLRELSLETCKSTMKPSADMDFYIQSGSGFQEGSSFLAHVVHVV